MKSPSSSHSLGQLAPELATRQFIAAATGTYLLHYQRDLHNIEVWHENVIAWAVDSCGYVDPVTFQGPVDSTVRSSIVLFPDGRVQDYDGLYDNYDVWLEDLENDGPARPRRPNLRLVGPDQEEADR